MPSTDASLTITAEENSSKRLLVLHKPETGLKIGRQTGENRSQNRAANRRKQRRFYERRCGSQRPATPTASRF